MTPANQRFGRNLHVLATVVVAAIVCIIVVTVAHFLGIAGKSPWVGGFVVALYAARLAQVRIKEGVQIALIQLGRSY